MLTLDGLAPDSFEAIRAFNFIYRCSFHHGLRIGGGHRGIRRPTDLRRGVSYRRWRWRDLLLGQGNRLERAAIRAYLRLARQAVRRFHFRPALPTLVYDHSPPAFRPTPGGRLRTDVSRPFYLRTSPKQWPLAAKPAIPQAEVFDVSAAGFTPVLGVRQIRRAHFGADGAVAAHTSGPGWRHVRGGAGIDTECRPSQVGARGRPHRR